MEHDFHQVGTDVGNFREYAAANPQGACSERLADGKSDKRRASQFFRHKGKDADHEKQFHADQQKAHAHPGAKANVDDVHGIAAEGGEGGTGVGNRIDPDAEPGHAVGTEDAHYGTEKDYQNSVERRTLQSGKIINDADGDQDP